MLRFSLVLFVLRCRLIDIFIRWELRLRPRRAAQQWRHGVTQRRATPVAAPHAVPGDASAAQQQRLRGRRNIAVGRCQGWRGPSAAVQWRGAGGWRTSRRNSGLTRRVQRHAAATATAVRCVSQGGGWEGRGGWQRRRGWGGVGACCSQVVAPAEMRAIVTTTLSECGLCPLCGASCETCATHLLPGRRAS